jgi:hypothetical protein
MQCSLPGSPGFRALPGEMLARVAGTLLLAVVLCLPGLAWADDEAPEPGKVLAQFDAPGNSPHGLAWDGEHLWLVDTATTKLFKPAFDAPHLEFRGVPAPLGGMAFDGKHLWLGTLAGWSSRMNQLDPADGSVGLWYFSKGYPRALACDGTWLWSASESAEGRPAIIYRYDLANGVCVSHVNAPGESPAGLAYDGQHLWYLDAKTRQIYKLVPDEVPEGKP